MVNADWKVLVVHCSPVKECVSRLLLMQATQLWLRYIYGVVSKLSNVYGLNLFKELDYNSNNQNLMVRKEQWMLESVTRVTYCPGIILQALRLLFKELNFSAACLLVQVYQGSLLIYLFQYLHMEIQIDNQVLNQNGLRLWLSDQVNLYMFIAIC